MATKKTMTRQEIVQEIHAIHVWMRENDWKPNKIVTGEWTTEDERWTAYCAERLVKRARLDELTSMLAE